jgi:hypothetical protein
VCGDGIKEQSHTESGEVGLRVFRCEEWLEGSRYLLHFFKREKPFGNAEYGSGGK